MNQNQSYFPNRHEISQIFDKNAQKEGISCLKKTNEFCPFGFVFKFSTASGTTLPNKHSFWGYWLHRLTGHKEGAQECT